jgi:hypothetical protein
MYLSTSTDLQGKVFDTELGNLLEQLLALFGVLEDPSLDLLEHLGATSLDHVTEQGPGSATEAVQRHAATELLSGHCDGLVNVIQRLLDVDFSFHDFLVLLVVGGHERVGEVRSFLVDHDDLHTHGLRNDEDVGEDDGAINETFVTINRLQSQGRGNLGRTTALEEVVGAFGLVVFGQVAASLTHDPHRWALDLLTTRGAQEKVVLHRREFGHVDFGLDCVDVRTWTCCRTRVRSLDRTCTPHERIDLSSDIMNDRELFSPTRLDT